MTRPPSRKERRTSFPFRAPTGCGSRSPRALRWIGAALLFPAFLARVGAQEIPRPSAARQAVRAQTLGDLFQGSPAAQGGGLFRVGKLVLRGDMGVTTEWTDNVNQSSNSAGGADLIITPSVGLTATLPISNLNTLRFRASIGYQKYLRHPNLDQENFVLDSGTGTNSGLSFDMLVDNLRINFHDRFSVDNDLANVGSVSGVATLPRFSNTVGVSALWDMNAVIFHLGYDHRNFVTLGSPETTQGAVTQDQSRLNYATDQFSASASYKLGPAIQGGIEATAAYSRYPNYSSADFGSYTFGPTFEIQLTKFTHVSLSGGIKLYSSASGQPAAVSLTSAPVASSSDGNAPGYYADVSIIHRLNRFYSDTLSVGHSDDASSLSGRAAIDYIRYTSSWRFGPRLSLGTTIYFNNVTQNTASAFGGPTATDYTLYGVSLGTSWRVGKNGSANASYSFTKKDSAAASQDYTQNRFILGLGFGF
jgi:hypothetical protein